MTSKDVLYLVISFCVLWVTVFLCWMFYYLARILRNTSQIVEEFRVRLQKLSETISHIRDKVEQMSSLMSLATGGVSGFVKNIVKHKANSWVNKSSRAAKEAVDKAVEATAKGMKKAAGSIKK